MYPTQKYLIRVFEEDKPSDERVFPPLHLTDVLASLSCSFIQIKAFMIYYSQFSVQAAAIWWLWET